MIKDNFTRKAKVVRVIDGDTIEVDIDLGFYSTIRQRIRLLRVNCDEIVGINSQSGLESKIFTESKVLNKDIYLVTEKTDTFSRWLGEVYFYENDQLKNLSDELLKNNLAEIYP